ncbi:hypothetical protein D3C81_1173260 [compost metagenome]
MKVPAQFGGIVRRPAVQIAAGREVAVTHAAQITLGAIVTHGGGILIIGLVFKADVFAARVHAFAQQPCGDSSRSLGIGNSCGFGFAVKVQRAVSAVYQPEYRWIGFSGLPLPALAQGKIAFHSRPIAHDSVRANVDAVVDAFLSELEFTMLIELRHPHFAIGTDDLVVIGITWHAFVGSAIDLTHAGQVPGKAEWTVATLTAVTQRELRIPAPPGRRWNRQLERGGSGRAHSAPTFADGGDRCAFGDGRGGDAQLLLIRHGRIHCARGGREWTDANKNGG